MTRVNIAELKANLSRYLRMVRGGREVQVMDRTNPVALIVPVEPSSSGILSSRPPLKPFADLEIRPVRVKGSNSLEALLEERGDR